MLTRPLIACTRMYNASEVVARFWWCLVQEVQRLSGLSLNFERYSFPLDIEDLWNRPDLGLSFICGRAFTLYGQRHIPIAVPLRIPQNAPLYHTKLLVREDSPYACLEDSFGSRLGWTVSHSHSGYWAVKKHVAPHQAHSARPLYEEVGPLHTPANCLKALAEGMVDVAPLDAYYYDLLRQNAPDALAGTRVLARTGDYPMPFLAASPGVDGAVCQRLIRAVQEAAALPVMRPVLNGLCISGFALPDTAAYAVLGNE